MKYKLILNYTTSSGKQYRQAVASVNDVDLCDDNIDEMTERLIDSISKGEITRFYRGSETIWLNPDHVESVVIQKCVVS